MIPPKPPKPSFMADVASAFPSEEEKASIVEVPAGRRARGKLQPWMIPVAVSILKEGMPIKYAAEKIGVSKGAMERWIQEGQDADADPLMAEFSAQCFAARADGNASNWRRLRMHAEVDARTAIHLATIADRETHTEKKEVKIEVGHEPAMEADLSALSDEQLRLKAAYEDMMASLPRKLKA